MKIISFFNHKGGVSKTTTTYHVGWKLAQLGKRVLMVDADSQCNLSLTALGDEGYINLATTNPKNNIKSCLESVFYAVPELLKAAKCLKVRGLNNLYLLPGNFDISEFEVQLGVSFQLTSSFSTMKNLPGSFSYLLQKTAESLNIDYILIDLNPSLSAINQDFIISSDYFIIPASPDYFSQMAVRSLARIIPTWEKWADQARVLFEDSTYPLPKIKPKFLGYTINNYTIRDGEPTQAFGEIIEKFDETIRTILIPSLDKESMLLPIEAYQNNYCLAQISSFQTLQTKYHKFGKPVYALTDKELEASGYVLSTQQEKRTFFDETYSKLANRILTLIDRE